MMFRVYLEVTLALVTLSLVDQRWRGGEADEAGAVGRGGEADEARGYGRSGPHCRAA